MSELKPCPFCGGEARVIFEEEDLPDNSFHNVYCTNCGAQIWVTSKTVAIQKWDTRAETEAEKKIEHVRACIESYRIKKNESDPFEYGRFQEWRAIKTDIDEIMEAPNDNT